MSFIFIIFSRICQQATFSVCIINCNFSTSFLCYVPTYQPEPVRCFFLIFLVIPVLMKGNMQVNITRNSCYIFYTYDQVLSRWAFAWSKNEIVLVPLIMVNLLGNNMSSSGASKCKLFLDKWLHLTSFMGSCDTFRFSKFSSVFDYVKNSSTS